MGEHCRHFEDKTIVVEFCCHSHYCYWPFPTAGGGATCKPGFNLLRHTMV